MKTVAVTDKNGKAVLDVPPGVYTFSVEKEGYEPVVQTLEVGSTETSTEIRMRPISKAFIRITNNRFRALIRANSKIPQIEGLVGQSNHLVDLASSGLKKTAAKELAKTSELALKRIGQIRRIESSTSVRVATSGIEFSKRERKKK